MASIFVLIYLMSLFPTANSFCDGQKRQQNLIKAVVQLSDWFRANHGNFTTLEAHIASLMMVSLRLAGHQPKALLSDYHVNNVTILDSFKAHLNKTLPRTKSLTTMAYITMGSLALCQKPRLRHNFTKTFIEGLDTFQRPDAQDFNNYFQYSVVVLALCHGSENIQQTVANKIVLELEKGHQSLSKSGSTMPDTIAMATMALSCIRRKTKIKDNVDGTILKYLDNLMDGLQSQKYWNIHSKSLVVQALSSLPSYVQRHPNHLHINKYYKELIKDILEEQDVTGSFGDVLANIQVLLALTGRSLVHLGDLSCHQEEVHVLEIKNRKISVCVQLAFQRKTSWKYYKQVNLTVVQNTTAMELLKFAAQRNDAYHYEAVKTSFGHMITAISGVKQDPRAGFYWLLYANANTMASNGVDMFIPGNNTCVIFRYENINSKNDNNQLAN